MLTTSGANINANVGGTAFPDMLFTIFSAVVLFFYHVVVFAGYGVQKNMSYGAGGSSTGVPTSQYTAVRPGLNLEILFFNGSFFFVNISH